MVTTRNMEKEKAAAAKAATRPSSRVTRYSVPRTMESTSVKQENSQDFQSEASTSTLQTTQVRKLPDNEHRLNDFFESVKQRNSFPDLTRMKPVPSYFYVSAIDNYKRQDRWEERRVVDGRIKKYVIVGPTEKDKLKYEIKVETHLLWKAQDKEAHLQQLMRERKLWFQLDGRKYLDWSTIDLMVDTDWKLLRFVPPRYYDHKAVRR